MICFKAYTNAEVGVGSEKRIKRTQRKCRNEVSAVFIDYD